MQNEYNRLLAIFLENNPQYTPAEGEALNADVDHHIWSEVIKEKGPNGCFFGAGNLASNYRAGDRNLFQRVRDGEGGSRQPHLTREQAETVRQLALSEARRENEALRQQQQQQMEMMQKAQSDMEQQHARQIEGLLKRQSEMEAQMRRFFEGGGSSRNVPDPEPEDDRVDDDWGL